MADTDQSSIKNNYCGQQIESNFRNVLNLAGNRRTADMFLIQYLNQIKFTIKTNN
jgi:hypothetical protein